MKKLRAGGPEGTKAFWYRETYTVPITQDGEKKLNRAKSEFAAQERLWLSVLCDFVREKCVNYHLWSGPHMKHEDALFVRDAVTDAVLAAFALLVRDSNRGITLDSTLVELKHEVIKAVNQRIQRYKVWEERREQGFGARTVDEIISGKGDKV